MFENDIAPMALELTRAYYSALARSETVTEEQVLATFEKFVDQLYESFDRMNSRVRTVPIE